MGIRPREDSPSLEELQERVSADELLVRYTSVHLMEQDGVVVDEQSDRVIVTVYEREPVGGVKPMPIGRTVRVRLNAPLAGRPLVDGAPQAAES